MQNTMKGLASICLMFFAVDAYAIQVQVKSSSNRIFALGFSVNGIQYGGLGTSYVNNNVPAGAYTFGLRAGSDVACTMANGKKVVNLQRNTIAYLKYDGQKCKLQISSK